MKKITFLIYTFIIATTGIFALIFKQHLVIGLESLIPIAIMAYMLFIGYSSYKHRTYFRHGRWHSYSDSFDFKYSKNSKGEGKFQIIDSREGPNVVNLILGYTMFIGAALNIPLIIFGSYIIKAFSVAIILVALGVGIVASLPIEIKETKQAKEAEKAKYEQWKRELEEQKKREELGKWK